LEKLQLLESVLGRGTKANRDYYQFHCPFCNHYKPKLGISLGTGGWKCWVCQAKGNSVSILFRKIGVDSRTISNSKSVFSEKVEYKRQETSNLELPKEFKPLWVENYNDFFYRKAKNYLLHRGVTEKDIIKHRLGYCDSGKYNEMIIFPEYNLSGQLIFFSGRSYLDTPVFKFSIPENVDKNIIYDEDLINWQEPVILVESKLDSITVRRNSISMGGKIPSTKLKTKIIEEKTPKIYICLDGDAMSDIINLCEYFIENGIDSYRVVLPENEDPSSLGYEKIWGYIKNASRVDRNDIFEYNLLKKLR